MHDYTKLHWYAARGMSKQALCKSRGKLRFTNTKAQVTCKVCRAHLDGKPWGGLWKTS